MNKLFNTFAAAAALAAFALPIAAIAAIAAEAPTDPQIAHIAYTAGVVDIGYAQIALKRSHNKAVREFAQEMVNDHKAVNDKALALAKKLGVTPEDNATSRVIASQAAAKCAELLKLSGSAFDRAYAENELAYHTQVNEAVDSQLIPSASNEELKDLLKVGLKIFRGHQQHAEHMVARLERKTAAMKE